MVKKDILRPRLRGGRFENGAIPLEFLVDLAQLQKMVMEVARWHYLQDHPRRQRVPHGFASAVEIELSALERGSSIPIISISAAQETRMGELPYEQYFIDAAESIIKSIRAAIQGFSSSSNDYILPILIKNFVNFGRNLRSDEFVELQSASSELSVRFDQRIRMRILEFADSRVAYTKEVAIRGEVTELDKDRMTFEMQQIYGRKVSGHVHDQYYAAFLKAFNGSKDDARVLVEGIGKHNRQGSLLSLESVERVTVLDPLDFHACLDEFRNMQDGWHEGDGKAPPHSGLDWLSHAFARGYHDDIPLPYTYPTFEGGVQCEWTIGQFYIQIKIDLDARKGDWIRFDENSDFSVFEDEESLNLDDPSAWDWMATKIRETLERAE